MRKCGIYRVVCSLPGSLSNCSHQFLYKDNMNVNVEDIAEKYAKEFAIDKYNVPYDEIEILSIEFVRPIHKSQKTICNFYNCSESDKKVIKL